MSKKGYVYIARVNGRNDLFKIGYTNRHPEKRVSELSGDYSCMRFDLVYSKLHDKPKVVEGMAHRLLKSKVHDREVFKCTLNQAIDALKDASKGKYRVVNNFDDALWAAFYCGTDIYHYAQNHRAVFTYLCKKFFMDNRVINGSDFNPVEFKVFLKRRTSCL